LKREDLDTALNAHAVWLGLATQYLADNPHSHFSRLRSLFSLTTGQLRQRFEKPVIANYIWTLSKEIYPSVKRLKYPPSPLLTVKIAPGGRWVFGGAKKCTVYYWDLDSKDPEPCVLAPVEGVRKLLGWTCSIVRIDFVVEHGDPLSGFIIALVGCDCESLIRRVLEELIDRASSGQFRKWKFTRVLLHLGRQTARRWNPRSQASKGTAAAVRCFRSSRLL
jgi:hypothetical protein